MKFYSWNVNGIRAVVRKGTFQKFIAEHQPDILCLQETKAERGQAEIDLAEYHEYWNSATRRAIPAPPYSRSRSRSRSPTAFRTDFAKNFSFRR